MQNSNLGCQNKGVIIIIFFTKYTIGAIGPTNGTIGPNDSMNGTILVPFAPLVLPLVTLVGEKIYMGFVIMLGTHWLANGNITNDAIGRTPNKAFVVFYIQEQISLYISLSKPLHEKICLKHMRKQRCRSAPLFSLHSTVPLLSESKISSL